MNEERKKKLTQLVDKIVDRDLVSATDLLSDIVRDVASSQIADVAKKHLELNQKIAEEDEHEDDNDSDYGEGDIISVEVGDKIKCSYGSFWVTGTAQGDRLWTSEYEEDIESGKGRGVRYSYVTAIQKEGRGPWYPVRLNDFDEFTVIKSKDVEESRKKNKLRIFEEDENSGTASTLSATPAPVPAAPEQPAGVQPNVDENPAPANTPYEATFANEQDARAFAGEIALISNGVKSGRTGNKIVIKFLPDAARSANEYQTIAKKYHGAVAISTSKM